MVIVVRIISMNTSFFCRYSPYYGLACTLYSLIHLHCSKYSKLSPIKRWVDYILGLQYQHEIVMHSSFTCLPIIFTSLILCSWLNYNIFIIYNLQLLLRSRILQYILLKMELLQYIYCFKWYYCNKHLLWLKYCNIFQILFSL